MRKVSQIIALLFISIAAFSQLSVKNLHCESLSNPIGIDAIHPRLAWQLVSGIRNTTQTAYETKVAATTHQTQNQYGTAAKFFQTNLFIRPMPALNLNQQKNIIGR